MSNLAGKDILITGGAGSIGSALARRIFHQDPSTIRILDANEQGLFRLKSELTEHSDQLRFLIGDVRDRDRLRMAMEDIDVVFHAAALKHVALNEYNPFEAAQTNVQGTQNVIRAAIDEDVDSFIGISTDKASHPTSVMGATKLLAERLIVAANTYTGDRDIRFGCVRFGNVAASKGSVIPVFVEQIREGGPISVTDEEMTRFVMPPKKAVSLVLKTQEQMVGGEIFILKMPAFKLGDLAEVMRNKYAPQFGFEPDDVPIDVIGRRPGERMHEKLISHDEFQFTESLEEMYVLLPQIDIPEYQRTASDESLSTYSSRLNGEVDGEFSSAKAPKLSKDEISTLLDEINIQTLPDNN